MMSGSGAPAQSGDSPDTGSGWSFEAASGSMGPISLCMKRGDYPVERDSSRGLGSFRFAARYAPFSTGRRCRIRLLASIAPGLIRPSANRSTRHYSAAPLLLCFQYKYNGAPANMIAVPQKA